MEASSSELDDTPIKARLIGEKMTEKKQFLVTAGPTVEAIDPVRFLSNRSTGKMGYAIAAELAARGAKVTLVSGPTALDTPAGVERVDVTSADEMFEACVSRWPAMDGAVMCAAVADYTPVSVSVTKIKKIAAQSNLTEQNVFLELKPTRDIAAELGRTKRSFADGCAGQVLIGFALETDDEEANALAKLERKNLDAIVLNSLRDAGAGFGGDTNKITVFTRSGGRKEFPLESKAASAKHILDEMAI